jgi:hypothetical protein
MLLEKKLDKVIIILDIKNFFLTLDLDGSILNKHKMIFSTSDMLQLAFPSIAPFTQLGKNSLHTIIPLGMHFVACTAHEDVSGNPFLISSD